MGTSGYDFSNTGKKLPSSSAVLAAGVVDKVGQLPY
jgi:hypothetical protein